MFFFVFTCITKHFETSTGFEAVLWRPQYMFKIIIFYKYTSFFTITHTIADTASKVKTVSKINHRYQQKFGVVERIRTSVGKSQYFSSLTP